MNAMPLIVRYSGPWGYALVVLAGVILLLTIRSVSLFTQRQDTTETGLPGLTNAVLFWGVAAAVLGFLGQCHGVYSALNEILAAAEVSPQILAEGFVISFLPALFGLGIFAFALVVWISLRVTSGRAFQVSIFLLAVFSCPGCETGAQNGAGDLAEGVWVLEADANVFLWEFEADPEGAYRCVVHDILGGLKFMETPCASVNLEGEALSLEMPNGVRYEGPVDLAGGLIDGKLLYVDGTLREAPLEWAPVSEFSTLFPRPQGEGQYAYGVPEARGDGFPVVDAADEGVDSRALEGTVNAILQGNAGFLKSVLVLRRGALLMEEYFHGYGPDDLFPILSCTKSVSSLLVGLAIQEGKISGVSAPLLDFFPQERSGAGQGWEDLTLRHLLTMSLALDWSPAEAQNLHGTGPEAFRQILGRNVRDRPGEDWEYVNMNVNLLAGVLHQATGEHAEAFAKRTLFEPLGIHEWNWAYGKTGGFNLMDGSLRLRPRDMAKIGVMVMNGGVWDGERILEEEWIRSSVTPVLAAGTEGEGYGYLWWTMEFPGTDGEPLQVVFANGWGSQFVLLFPELDLVVVTTGGNQENGKHLAIGEVLIRELLPGVTRNPA